MSAAATSGDDVPARPGPQPVPDPPCSICVGFATHGRPTVVAAVVDLLRHQTLAPTTILLCCAEREDAGTLLDRDDVTILLSERGATKQRNTILDNIPPATEIVVFFDDDFVPHPDWLRAVAAVFRAHPDVAAVTGTVVVDGIHGPGIGFEEARRIAAAQTAPPDAAPIENYSPYGCNMAFRRSAIADLRFDERLVLYGWLEDRDFGAGLVRRGWRILKVRTASGVHMGVKSGRVSGRQFGYSQVVNPVYMSRKGTMRWRAMAHHMLRNIAANLVRSGRPEPHIDRFGRLRGNLIGLTDVVRGRVTPERAERL